MADADLEVPKLLLDLAELVLDDDLADEEAIGALVVNLAGGLSAGPGS